MSDTINTCPTDEQLKSLIDASLPEDQQVTTQSHVDGCTNCQSRLERLVSGTESWDAAIDRLRDESPRSEETILSDAIRQMKADEFVASSGTPNGPTNPIEFLEPSDTPGTIGRLGTYDVMEVVGQGGMGVVLKAFDPALHRVVAVKVLAPYLAHNSQARKRFVREAQAIAAVSHDHVITIHAIDESTEQPRIVMQFVAGRSLQQKIDAEGSLDLKEILRIGMQTAAGLAAAHAQGLVHRDVKPSNILLENGIQRVKLTDFGLARAVDDASLTQSGAIAGTPQYMAPEQANGDAVDYRADLFSLGSVLYAMCVGHSPFRASTTMGVLKRVCHDPPRPIQELNSDIPNWLCAIIMKLLAKKPEDRYPTAKSVSELLERWLAHVQQPTVIAKPSVTSGESSASNTSIPKNSVHDEPNPRKSARTGAFISDLYSRTIFFQPVTLRLVLFLILVGMALTILTFACSGTRHPSEVEVFALVSFAYGLVFCFVSLLLISLFRFIATNFAKHLLPNSVTGFDATSSSPTNESVRPDSSGIWSRENAALAAGIAGIVCSGNVVFGSIVAFVVWAGRDYFFRRIRLAQQRDEWFSQNLVEPTPQSTFPVNFGERTNGIVTKLKSMLAGISALPSKVVHLLSRSNNRVLLSILWFITGGIDLAVFAMIALKFHHQLMFFMSLAFALISFLACHFIFVRQNASLIQAFSFIGLLPFSFGAIIRFPLSISTLFWLDSADVQASFVSAPWNQTKLGQFARYVSAFMMKSAITTVTILIWTLLFDGLLAAIFFFVVVPFGPSNFQVIDKSLIRIKGHPNAQFELIASGSGLSHGLVPPIYPNHPATRQQVRIGCIDNACSQGLIVRLGSQIFNETTNRPLTKSDIESRFRSLFNEAFPEHTENLYQAIRELNATEGFAPEMALPSNPEMAPSINWVKSIELAKERFGRSVGDPWPGFVRAGNMLDPNLFEIYPQAGNSYFDCSLAPWFMGMCMGTTGLIWFVVTGWIIKRRHFPRVSKAQVQPAN